MSPCLLIFGTKEKKIRKMFINLCEPISAVEKSPYSGMQSNNCIMYLPGWLKGTSLTELAIHKTCGTGMIKIQQVRF